MASALGVFSPSSPGVVIATAGACPFNFPSISDSGFPSTDADCSHDDKKFQDILSRPKNRRADVVRSSAMMVTYTIVSLSSRPGVVHQAVRAILIMLEAGCTQCFSTLAADMSSPPTWRLRSKPNRFGSFSMPRSKLHNFGSNRTNRGPET